MAPAHTLLTMVNVSRRASPIAILLPVAALVACGADPRPVPIDLAVGLEPTEVEGDGWPGIGSGAARLTTDDGAGTVLELELGPSDWSPGPLEGVLMAEVALSALSVDDATLHVDGREVEALPADSGWKVGATLPATDTWTLIGGRLLLVRADPPERARLRFPTSAAGSVEGRWRVRFPGLTADGLDLTSGQERTLVLPDSDTPRRLCCDTFTAGLLSDEARIEARFDTGERVVWTQALSVSGSSIARSLPVPRDAGEVRFRLLGPAATAGILAPVLIDERSEPDDRPDIVVVLADTLRADMLARYRSRATPSAPMPLLDARADQARVFTEARSVASWTLPSQSTLLSGLPPRSHGAVAHERALAPEAPRLARRLRDAGYRTVAVTEGSYVSRAFGLDLGFQVFDERSRDVHATVAAALEHLRSEDERPLFLYVQTYRAHSPYRATSSSPRADLAAGLPPRIDLDAIDREVLVERLGSEDALAAAIAESERTIPEQWADYLGGVHDLDRALAPLFDALDARSARRPVRTVFTSDHGEEFGEHAIVGHGHGTWAGVLRIPMLVFGTDVVAGSDPTPTTLLDLAPTLTAWAGLDTVTSDRGVPLETRTPTPDASDEPRPIFAWACSTPPHDDARAVVLGSLKWVERGAPSRHFLYDLATDPLERTPIRTGSTPPSEFTDLVEMRNALSTPPTFAIRSAEIDSAMKARLEALGYGE